MTAAQAISVLNSAALLAIMFAMGLQVDAKLIWAFVRRGPLVFALMFANYVLVPAVAIGLLLLFRAEPLVSVGFIILAVCPGAPISPPLAALGRGDMPLAVGMMVVLAGASAILSPLLLSILMSPLDLPGELRIDPLAVVRVLAMAQMLPLVAGLIVHKVLPRLARRMARPIAALGNVLFFSLIVLIIVVQFPTLYLIKRSGWSGMSLLLLSSIVIGWICGGRSTPERLSASMCTGPRNAAVGLAIAAASFPGTAALTAVVAYGLFSTLGSLLVALMIRPLIATQNPVNIK